jgi:hypothetical protein
MQHLVVDWLAAKAIVCSGFDEQLVKSGIVEGFAGHVGLRLQKS